MEVDVVSCVCAGRLIEVGCLGVVVNRERGDAERRNLERWLRGRGG